MEIIKKLSQIQNMRANRDLFGLGITAIINATSQVQVSWREKVKASEELTKRLKEHSKNLRKKSGET